MNSKCVLISPMCACGPPSNCVISQQLVSEPMAHSPCETFYVVPDELPSCYISGEKDNGISELLDLETKIPRNAKLLEFEIKIRGLRGVWVDICKGIVDGLWIAFMVSKTISRKNSNAMCRLYWRQQ